MKKTLLTLGAVAALTLGLASCGSTDCVCTVGLDKTDTDLQTTLKYDDYDGDCDEITEAEFPEAWSNVLENGGFYDCVED